VALLNDANRHHFSLVGIVHASDGPDAAGGVSRTYQLDGKSNLQVPEQGVPNVFRTKNYSS
jgi:hypothetical protein